MTFFFSQGCLWYKGCCQRDIDLHLNIDHRSLHYREVSDLSSSSSSKTIHGFSRYQAICHPLTLNSRTGVGRARKMIVLIWVTSVVSAYPWSIFAKVGFTQFYDWTFVKVSLDRIYNWVPGFRWIMSSSRARIWRSLRGAPCPSTRRGWTRRRSTSRSPPPSSTSSSPSRSCSSSTQGSGSRWRLTRWSDARPRTRTQNAREKGERKKNSGVSWSTYWAFTVEA